MTLDPPDGDAPRQERLARYAALRRRLRPRTSLGAFASLVQTALDELPAEIRRRIENVAVVVQERPDPVRLAALGYDPDQDLLGLYEGVPHPQRPGSYHLVLPDRITIFRQPILDQVGSGDSEAIVREVRKTVLHEVAHHFGIDDAELARLERQGRQQE